MRFRSTSLRDYSFAKVGKAISSFSFPFSKVSSILYALEAKPGSPMKQNRYINAKQIEGNPKPAST